MTKKRLRQLASGLVIVLALGFIVLSTTQITAAVFGGAPPARAPTADEAACGAKLETLEAALERASDHASHEPDDAHARTAFEAAILPEWNERAAAETACNASPRSREAWAALLRLKSGIEGRSQKDARDVAPLRRDFQVRVPRALP